VNRIEGTIEDIVYLGPARKYNIATEHGTAIVRVPEREAAAARIGDRVMFGWAPDDAVLLADTETPLEAVSAT
jgi:hypothetical protein